MEKLGVYRVEFQFLLGTLKTPRGTRIPHAIFWFQFLLGTLKTISAHPHRRRFSSVSIPLRYAKNGDALEGVLWMNEFQFLLGTLKTSVFRPSIAIFPSFNSS